MRSVELFTGAGGLALGLEAAGFEPVLMVEWDKDAEATVRANARPGGPTELWPYKRADVRDIDFTAIPGEIDLVAGGPPCQPFSIGGKHGGPDDPRDMWPQAIRAVRELRPKAFLFENVRGLARDAFADYLRYIVARLRHPSLTARPNEDWRQHLERLDKMKAVRGDGPSYHVEVHKVNAADYGAAQKRFRVVVIGVRQDLDLNWRFPAPTHSREALVWDQWVTGDYWRRHGVRVDHRPVPSAADTALARRLDNLFEAPSGHPWVTVRDAIAGLPDPGRTDRLVVANHRFQAGAKAYKGHTGSPLDEPAKALKAGDHGVPGGENMLALPDGSVRYFTVRESARLQGFPDHYEFPSSWTESMRQLGNAVPAQLSSAMASSLAECLRENERGARRRFAA